MTDSPGYLLGVDLGTTALKAVAWDHNTGSVIAQSSLDYPSTTGGLGHEQNVHDWESTLGEVLSALWGQVDPHRALAIGLSGHMHALVLLDSDNRPIRPVITWADRRARAEADLLAADPQFEHIVLNRPVEAFTAPRIAWLVKNEPDKLERATSLVGAKDVIGGFLTDNFASDPSDAMGTLLWDPSQRIWSPYLVERVGLSVSALPRVLPSESLRGLVTEAASTATGLPKGLPVYVGAGDVSAAAVGAGVSDSHTVCLNAGTAAQAMRVTSAREFGGGFLFHPALGSGMLAMSSSYAAGASIQWAQKVLALPGPFWEVVEAADSETPGPTYLPYMRGSAAPVANADVRGAFLGQGPGHTATDLAAAVVDGVAFSCLDSIDAVSALDERPERIVVFGGVSRSARWRQVIANCLEQEVMWLPDGGSALGAAVIAGVGQRLLSSRDVFAAVSLGATTIEPRQANSSRSAQSQFRAYSELLTSHSARPSPEPNTS